MSDKYADRLMAEQEARYGKPDPEQAHRQRIVETARALFVQWIGQSYTRERSAAHETKMFLIEAEAFEAAAREYLKGEK